MTLSQLPRTLNGFSLWLVSFGLTLVTINHARLSAEQPNSSEAERHRVVVSTDIGGTDPDDFQSMVHLLLYADDLAIEGLISSPYGPGRKQDILRVIEAYERDYDNLTTYSSRYPTPDALRMITKQGEVDEAPYAGTRQATEGSNWIIDCAKRDDSRPLYLLVWGGLEDLGQALHDAPEILPKLRVYWIGGPNKKWSTNAYQYLVDHHSQLWFIEANSTYRGWFVGGDQSGDLGNSSFVSQHVAGHGALGDFFATQLGGTIKMGDTPSVAWLLHGGPTDPTQSSWGGQFVRTTHRPRLELSRMPTRQDQIEQFAILELRLRTSDDWKAQPNSVATRAQLVVENQKLAGTLAEDGSLRFRFSPKDQKVYQFTLNAGETKLSGEITATAPTHALASLHANVPTSDAALGSSMLTNWWTDSLDSSLAEGNHYGARSVSRYRAQYLASFAERLKRCQRPKPAP